MKNEKLKNILELGQSTINLYETIDVCQKQITDIENKIKSILPKGYFYTYDIDTSWNHPKKYSIKHVSCGSDGSIYLTVKEVFKKKPWPTFTGEHYYNVKDFFNLSIYKTDQEAIDGHMNRPCPKCGRPMKNAVTTWCARCMQERQIAAEEFNNTHFFYDPKDNHIFQIKYEDELTRWHGYEGKSFIIRRLDNNEILHTTNLWSVRSGPNTNNYPEIEFIKE